MELVMLLSTAIIAALVGIAGVHLAHRAKNPATRVHLALWSLAVIPVSLSVCALSLSGRFSVGNPFCDDCPTGTLTSLVFSFGATALGLALLVGLLRIVLLTHTLRRRLFPAPVYLQGRADDLARRAGGHCVPVLLLGSEMPVAFTWGLVRPRVVLSTWMVEHLDRKELEAVLAHELAHAVGRDCRTIWLATLLRDATFYLPWAWRARRAVITGKELLADDAAVAATGRPVALASAIAKVCNGRSSGHLSRQVQRFSSARPDRASRCGSSDCSARRPRAANRLRGRAVGASPLGGSAPFLPRNCSSSSRWPWSPCARWCSLRWMD